MRYIDTGSREPADALGTWLNATILEDETITSLRWQTGFFGAESLSYFVPVLSRLREVDGILHLLVGSNDGSTSRSDIEALLPMVGDPRTGQRIAVVKFDNAYFHPKVIHFEREDGSAAAYVGSANLTTSGVTSLHIEAGILLDTRDGDDSSVLAEIATAVDWWFAEARDGLYLISTSEDLDLLVTSGVLNVPLPVLPTPPRSRAGTRRGIRLAPLLEPPNLPEGISVASPPTVDALPPSPPAVVPSVASSATPTPPADWDKPLTKSDAQRKETGNQRGSITLVGGGHPIDPQTYFRYDFFAGASWADGATRTGEPREIAVIPFDVELLGEKLGVLNMEISYAANREAAQRNYTTLLHLGALAPYFMAHDLTGRRIHLVRGSDGSFALSVS